jgi:hypothetical protein
VPLAGVGGPLSAIRQIASAGGAARIALGQFEKTVSVWNLEPPRRVATFDTILDFGGQRLALSEDGATVVAAAFDFEGVAAYDASTGKLRWQRRDIEHPQVVSVSHATAAIYVGVEDGPCSVLALENGETLAQIPGVRQVVESPHGPLVFLDEARPHVAGLDRTRLFSIERGTFAFLAIAFAPSRLAVSESGGPVTCFEIPSGDICWRFVPPQGTHCLELSYLPGNDQFAGVLWPFASGGVKELVTFDDRGNATTVKYLGMTATECFCPAVSALVTAECKLVYLPSGQEANLDEGASGGPG